MKRWVMAAAVMLVCSGAFGEKRPREARVAAPAGETSRVFHPAGLREWRGGKPELRVTVWYPAAEGAVERPEELGPPGMPLFHEGAAAKDAPLVAGARKLPLVVLSHGTGGSAEQMAWLGQALARAGFVAAAVDHPGNNGNEPYTPQGFTLWWERATDVSQAIDGLLADEALGPRIDHERIGVAGFSLGGYTVMELAGARTDISVLYDDCRAKPDQAWCQVPEMRQMKGAESLQTTESILAVVRKTSALSLARSGESYADERIHAVFAIAPAIEEVLTPESLKKIRLPVDVVVGNADTIAPAARNGEYLRAHVRGLKLTVLPGGVGHYTFLDTCTEAGKARLGVLCSDAAGVDREAVHAQVAARAVEFFSRELDVR